MCFKFIYLLLGYGNPDLGRFGPFFLFSGGKVGKIFKNSYLPQNYSEVISDTRIDFPDGFNLRENCHPMSLTMQKHFLGF